MTEEALKQLVTGLRAGRPDFTLPPVEVRQNFEALLTTLPVSDLLKFAPLDLAGVPALRAEFDTDVRKSALLYLHGGAFIAGSARGYRGLAGELGKAAGLDTYAIDYPLAPEHPFPHGLEACVRAYCALVERVGDSKRVVLAGDSAGAGLALASLIALRDRGIPLPSAALLISPWADLACEGRSMEEKAEEDPSLTASGLRACAAHYLGGADPRDPLASALYADMRGLPPLLIQVGSAEILLDDSVRIARAAGAAGVDVQLQIWPEMVHVWHAFSFMLSAGQRAIAYAGTFLRRCTLERREHLPRP